MDVGGVYCYSRIEQVYYQDEFMYVSRVDVCGAIKNRVRPTLNTQTHISRHYHHCMHIPHSAPPSNQTVKTMIYSTYECTYAYHMNIFNQMETNEEWKTTKYQCYSSDSLQVRNGNGGDDHNIRNKIYRSISSVYFIHTFFC